MASGRDDNATGRAIAALVRLSIRFAWLAAVVAVLAGGFAAHYAATHFALDSQTENLVSADAPWRVQEKRFDREFPQQNNLIVVVVDSDSPERDAEATTALAAKLAPQKQFFLSVRQPDGDPYFAQEGLMLLPLKDVQSTMAQLIKAQPFLGALAADPSLRGLLSSLSTALLGVKHGDTTLAALAPAMTALTNTLGDVEAGKPAFLSWRAMVTGTKASARETRRFILVKPRLDYTQLTPGTRASEAIRATAAALKLTPQNGVRVRLTGPVPMSDEEFATLAEHAGVIAAIIVAGMLLMLWLAVRSFRIITAIALTMIVGLTLTAAGALALLGPFNVISIAFIPLFVGLGVDFGIQFSVRYRAERHAADDLREALIRTGASIGGALALAAAAIAAGFLSFAPSGYAGLAKLGTIAGCGMIVTFVLSLTGLPAFLAILKPGAEAQEIGWMALAPLDDLIARHWKRIVTAFLAAGAAGVVLTFFLSFDFNPIHLRSAKTESVSTLLDLMKDPVTSPNTIDVLVPNRTAADALAAKLSRLPEVDGVMSIDTFIPKDQDRKLAIISDASFVLDPTINPVLPAPPPTDGDIIASLRSAAKSLRDVAMSSHEPSAAEAARLAQVLKKLADGAPALRSRARAALIPGMNTMLEQVRGVLQARKVGFRDLPPDLVRDWVAPDGTRRLEVSPRGDVSSNTALAKFTTAVRAVAPNATGTPIIIQESGRTIVNAFIKAGALSLIAIAILLAFWLRNAADVAFALAPLLFAFVFTLGTSVAIAMPLNFANIIALPLLFGIGVAFDIYFVIAWRNGTRQLLQSPLGRAVILSAGTTACGFGTLWFSSHPGTASMGALLLISLAWILIVVLILLPALLTGFSRKP
ncbi:MAG TPA: MMPL family transporter [Rhizomicrobium sp.]|nr:MMPL family transporter [Rhizomicrobium sp.]